LVPELLR